MELQDWIGESVTEIIEEDEITKSPIVVMPFLSLKALFPWPASKIWDKPMSPISQVEIDASNLDVSFSFLLYCASNTQIWVWQLYI